MPRKKLPQLPEYPFHLMARGNNREPFSCGDEFAWKTLAGELFVQQVLHGLKVHAFVLMPNHFHLLAASPNRNIDEVMRDFLSSSTRIMNSRTRRSGRVFGGRYFWSVVTGSSYYAHVLKYIYRNPVKAGLCKTIAEYPFSTYAGLFGTVPLPLVISPPENRLAASLSTEVESLDLWLNTPHSAEMNEAIRKGLRREEFQIDPSRTSRRKIDLAV